MIQALIDAYEAGGLLLAHATAGLTQEQETTRIGPGEWSIAEVVAHLLDSDLVMSDRMKRVIAEENPTLLAFDEEVWAKRLRSNEMPVDEGVALLVANRVWMTRILRKCTEADFARTGNHTEQGQVTLERIVSRISGHIDHHLKFIYPKRERLGVPVEARFTSGVGVYP